MSNTPSHDPRYAEAFDRDQYFCQTCGYPWFCAETATQCCIPPKCSDCGITASTTPCLVCSDAERVTREDRLFRIANKVWYLDYESPYVYWGAVDRFLRGKREVGEISQILNKPMPKWVWGTKAEPLCLDAERLLAEVGTRSHTELIESENIVELQALVDRWSAAQTIKVFDVDYATAVIIDTDLYDTVAAS